MRWFTGCLYSEVEVHNLFLCADESLTDAFMPLMGSESGWLEIIFTRAHTCKKWHVSPLSEWNYWGFEWVKDSAACRGAYGSAFLSMVISVEFRLSWKEDLETWKLLCEQTLGSIGITRVCVLCFKSSVSLSLSFSLFFSFSLSLSFSLFLFFRLPVLLCFSVPDK